MAEQPCVGSCNWHWRKAREAFDLALAGYDPLDPAQSRPVPPDLYPVYGDPWCGRCKTQIRRELAEIDDLASILGAMADGHRGRRPGTRLSRSRQSAAPSPSPTGDLLEELRHDIHGWETATRGTDPLARRGFLATETTTSISWLVTHFDDAILHPDFAVDFGREILRWRRTLKQLTSAGVGVQHKPVRCPRCDEYAVFWTEGDDHAECRGKGGTCGRLIGMDELDGLAVVQDAAHTKAVGGAPTRPAA
ncbi:MAG TPA: hypothetical protein VGS06_19560 [Streptosporangiaceae bacterium]|nr:hypothetical protein [Streptosporangiaceae bacterium]HEV2451152.1 hypothetical protein [Streptosporangiaceae bacterium]